MQHCFVVDLNRCTGCGACVIACTIENSHRKGEGINWREIYTFNEVHHPELPLFNFSLSCNHCEIPACLNACPSGAYSKDKETGAVIIDPQLCMGCKYCTWACPYDAPRFNPVSGVIEKCDFCNGRLKQNDSPACVTACPVGALKIEDIVGDIPIQRQDGFTNAGLNPSIQFKPLRSQQNKPESVFFHEPLTNTRLFEASQKLPERKITLKSEWTLVFFTSIAFILVALLTASIVMPFNPNPFLFLFVGIIGTGAGTIHLGHKERSYRAIFNFKKSWLSREIALFSAFLGLGWLYLMFFKEYPILGWITVYIGFFSLFAIDRIYQVAMKIGVMDFHSAHTVFDGLYLTGCLTGETALFITVGLLKLFLYLYRKWLFIGVKQKTHPFLSICRLLTGFFIPQVIFSIQLGMPALHNGVDIPWYYLLFIISVTTGELIDRVEFYDELEIITPRRQILLDMEKRLND